MTRRHTPRRSFRENDDVWSVFLALCKEDGTDASTVLRTAVRQYIEHKGGPRQTARVAGPMQITRPIQNEGTNS